MATLNYTTAVPVARTVGEVQQLLAEAGADAVATRYQDRQPVGVSFLLDTAHGQRHFDLPVNVVGVHKMLIEQGRTGQLKARPKGQARSVLTTPEHAVRVAWRIAKDWLEAQLALIQAGMATLDQVMLPYLRVESGRTLYEAYRFNEQRALENDTDV